MYNKLQIYVILLLHLTILCKITPSTYKFNTHIVANQTEEELLKSNNIFALVILALKYVIDTPDDYAKRQIFKKKLCSLLIERECALEKRKKLLIFIKEIMRLPNNPLHFSLGLSISQIAETVKISEQEVKNAIADFEKNKK